MKKSITKKIILKCYHIFMVANKEIIVIPLIISCTLFGCYVYLGIGTTNNYIEILNSISVLATFYLFSMEKLEITKMLQSMTKRLPERRNGKIYTEGVVLVQTYFALLIIQFFLLAIQYIFIIFKIEYILLLFMSISYIFTSFFFSIAGWQGFSFLNR